MNVNLIDLAKGFLTPDVVSKLSSLVGETPAKTQQAMETIVPTLAGAACNTASTPAGVSRLMSAISSAPSPDSILGNIGSLLGGGGATENLMKTGSGLISSLLGDKAGAVTNLVANASGIQ